MRNTVYYKGKPIRKPSYVPEICAIWDDSSRPLTLGPRRLLVMDESDDIWLYNIKNEEMSGANGLIWCQELRDNYDPIWVKNGPFKGSSTNISHPVSKYIIMLRDTMTKQ
jgi:hypothetical protein